VPLEAPNQMLRAHVYTTANQENDWDPPNRKRTHIARAESNYVIQKALKQEVESSDEPVTGNLMRNDVFPRSVVDKACAHLLGDEEVAPRSSERFASFGKLAP
jgi:hypothetical protein